MEESESSSPNKQENQHYVPQFYLRYWVVPDGVMVSNRMGGQVKEYPQYYAKSIGSQSYFYKINVDDVVWDMLCYRFGEEANTDPLIENTLIGLHRLKVANDFAKKEVEITLANEDAFKIFKAEVKRFNNVFLEKAYCRFENSVSPELNELVGSEINEEFVPSDKTLQSILTFYAFQYFRTRERMDAIKVEISQMMLNRGNSETVLTETQKQSVMKCMLYIFSNQFSNLLLKIGCTVNLFKNTTDVDYITSDCPAIYFKPKSGSDHSEGLMPLSPRLLIKLEIPDFKKEGTTGFGLEIVSDVNSVKESNKLIEKNSHFFVFRKIRK